MRNSTDMSTLLMLFREAFLVLCAFFCAISSVVYVNAEPSLIVEPAVPLLNVPFSVSLTESNIEVHIFVSRRVCSNALMIGKECKISKDSVCVFTVSGSDVGIDERYENNVPELFICTGKAFGSLSRPFQMSVIDSVPRYVKKGKASRIKFNEAVPVGTTIGFFRNVGCQSEDAIAGLLPVRLGEERDIQITWNMREIIYVCADASTARERLELPQYGDVGERAPPPPPPYKAQAAFVPASTLLVVPEYNVNSTKVLRHTKEAFRLMSIDGAVLASLSNSDTCEYVLQDPVSSDVLQIVEMSVEVRRGEYFMCQGWHYYKSKKVFSPSENKITVREYGVQPHTLYSNQLTRIVYTMDAGAAADQGVRLGLDFFESPDCTRPVPVAYFSDGKQLPGINARRSYQNGSEVSVSLPGTYYACLSGNVKDYPLARAAVVTVLSSPTVSVEEENNIVSGLDITVKLSGGEVRRSGTITVGLSMNADCGNITSRGEIGVGQSSAKFRVPEDALAEMTLCVSTPAPAKGDALEEADRGYVYPMKIVQTRRYIMRHNSLFLGVSETIHLDRDVKLGSGATGYFSLDNCATRVGPLYYMNATALYNVVFRNVGKHVLCVHTPDAMHPPSRPYANVGSVMVYGEAELSPRSVIEGVQTVVDISLVPPLSPVVISAADDCTSPIVEENATPDGKASITLLYESPKALSVCVGYKDSEEKEWKMRKSTTLLVSDVKVFPAVAFTEVSNRINFIVPDKASFEGLEVGFSDAAGGKCEEVQGKRVELAGPGPAHVIHTPVGLKQWAVCLKKRDKFVRIGTFKSEAQLEMEADPSIGVVDLPVSMRFRGQAIAHLQLNHYVVTDKVESCHAFPGVNAPLYGSGAIDPNSARAEPFIVKRDGNQHVCVGWKGNQTGSFFLYGGSVSAQRFTVRSTYAVRGQTNNIVASPVLQKSSFFLVKCTGGIACPPPANRKICEEAEKRYYTGPNTPLEKIELGTYALCQQDEQESGYAVGNGPIAVIDPIKATFHAREIRKYVETLLTLSGGDLDTRLKKLTVYVVPPSTDCSNADASHDSFDFRPKEMEKNITIVKTAAFSKDVKLCVALSQNDKLQVAVFDLHHYMSPAVIIAGRSMEITSGGVRSGTVKISTQQTCTDNVLKGGEEATITDYVSSLFVETCTLGAQNKDTLYYCEKSSSGSFVMRGGMQFIQLIECSRDRQPPIQNITVPPAQEITDYGIDTEVVGYPTISATTSCHELEQNRVMMTPRYDQKLLFFVCVRPLSDLSYVFTTLAPSITVENFRAMRPTIHSRLNSSSEALGPAMLIMNHPTATEETYLSDCKECGERLSNTPGIGSHPAEEVLMLTGVSGVKCVCVLGEGNALSPIPVAEVLVVNVPSVKKMDPAVVNKAKFHATLQPVVTTPELKPLYSMVPGEDVNYPWSHLYYSTFRGVYISESLCADVLSGNPISYVRKTGDVVLGPNVIPERLPSVSLCVGTPAGNLTVATKIDVSSDVIFPSKLVSRVDTEVFIPLSPNSLFRLRGDVNCGGEDLAPYFVTNEEARGVIALSGTLIPESPLPVVWTLCREEFEVGKVPKVTLDSSVNGVAAHVASSKRLVAVAQLEIFNPVHFDVRGRDILIGIPSVVYLTENLRASYLLPGFSTDESCKDRSESHGTWALVDGEDASKARRVAITANDQVKEAYFCATAPVNKTVVRVPMNSSLRFLPPTSVFPSTVVSCKVTTLSSCRAPESSGRQVITRVIKGDCCHPTDRGVVVGQVTERGDGRCSLVMDRKKVVDYPAGTEFDICSWDLTDNSYCITLGRVKDSGDMCDSGIAWGSLGTGAMVAIIACGLLLLIILVLLLICLLRRCCCGRAKEPDGQLVVRRKMDVSSVNLSDITETSGDPSQYGRVNPLLICLNSREESQAVTPHATSPGNGNVANPFTWLGDLSPGTHEFTIDDVERDDRDQIALQEARDRYNMAVAFTEGIERLRVSAKEREIHLDDSGEFNMYEMAVRRGDDGSFRPDIPLAGTSDLLNEIYMRRASQRERAYFRPREEIEVSVMNNMSELSTDNHDTSRLTSCDSMNYTTTQNFYDENAFVSESEAGRRLRMMNWEEEEWQAIVDTEFSDYVRLQQATQSTPLPLPHAVVFPFDAPLPVDEDGENHDTSQDDDLIIYEDGVTSVQVYDAPVVTSVVGRTQQNSVPREGSGLHPSTSLFSSPAPVELRRPSRGSGVFNVLSGPSRGM